MDQPFASPASNDAINKNPSISVNNKSDQLPIVAPVLQPTAPPYWQLHQRSVSNASHTSTSDRTFGLAPITLIDHTEPLNDEGRSLWAKSVTIQDYSVVSGSGVGAGAYVVWNCTVQTLDGGSITIRKRYSEFDTLRKQLLYTFPFAEGAMPPLPRKSVISKFQPKFLESRRVGLSYFLNCVLLNPEFAGSPVLKDFLFS